MCWGGSGALNSRTRLRESGSAVQACWEHRHGMGHEGTTGVIPWYYNYDVVLIEFVTLCPKSVLLCGGGNETPADVRGENNCTGHEV